MKKMIGLLWVSLSAAQEASVLRFNIPPGTEQWHLRGQRQQLCASGTGTADDVVIQKIGYDEDLELHLVSGGVTTTVKRWKARPRRSPLPKVNTAASIYQLPIRTFFARDEQRAARGRFTDLDNDVLDRLKELNIDYIWLTGVLEQAHPRSVDPDVVKGDAGSYYAVRDMWDVSNELGTLGEFDALIQRAHEKGLRVLVDLVMNHTARHHVTDVTCKADLNFGVGDDVQRAFDIKNNYLYLPSQRFEPPFGEYDIDLGRDGIQDEMPARVTGNDVLSPRPSVNDWYETAKLNYGHDLFSRRVVTQPRPKTWTQMLDVSRYWLARGVDGFRIDFAHVVPMEFWRWYLPRIKEEFPNAFLVAEAYENGGDLQYKHENLLAAGMDSIFHSELYWPLYNVARHGESIERANPFRLPMMREEIVTKAWNMTHYLENHDEVRVASKPFAPRLASRSHRAQLGLALSAYAALLPGHFLLQGGQEVGEDASVFGPFAGDNGKTSIFDYVYQKWVRDWLDGRESEWRSRYAQLMQWRQHPVFQKAHSGTEYYDLLAANQDQAQRHHVGAYIRRKDDEAFLVVTNAHPTDAVNVVLHLTNENGSDRFALLSALGIDPQKTYTFANVFGESSQSTFAGETLWRASGVPSGIYFPNFPARTTRVFAVKEQR